MTPAINVVNISECTSKELEKTTQPTPILSHLVNKSPPVREVFYDVWFIGKPGSTQSGC